MTWNLVLVLVPVLVPVEGFRNPKYANPKNREIENNESEKDNRE